MNKKIIVVGSGFSGSIIARKIAEELNRAVVLLDRRHHIGGNAYDEYDKNGILIQKYGPHFFNTNKYSLIELISKYSDIFRHDATLLSYIDGEYVQLPFNFRTVQQLLGDKKAESIIAALRQEFCSVGRDRVPISELVKSKNKEVSSYGKYLFDKAFRTYTAKQWGLNPEELDDSIMDRVPMAMSFDARYLNKDYQYLPKYGFHKLFENLLDHPNIQVQLGVEALEHLTFDDFSKKVLYDGEDVELLVFSGAIDELFSMRFGRLPYRSLRLEYKYYNQESVLPCEIVSYPQAPSYTRKTEYKKFTYGLAEKIDRTVVVTEFPVDYDPSSKDANIPYYPVLTKESMMCYEKYKELADSYKNIVLCGRLAEFRYYNMDVCIEHALEKFCEIKIMLGVMK